jgi:hypothetical protein
MSGRVLVFLAALAFAFPQLGCTAAGYAVGSAVDQLDTRPAEILGDGGGRLKPGTRVQVRLCSGTQLKGTFAGIETEPDSALVLDPLPRPGSLLDSDLSSAEARRLPLDSIEEVRTSVRRLRYLGLAVGVLLDVGWIELIHAFDGLGALGS